MFRGVTPLSLDGKGRFSIPAKYREQLHTLCNGQLIITIDRDRCLLIYPLPAWEDVERQLVALSSTDPTARLLKRLLLGHAEECEMDRHGRVLLSAPLRAYAHLDKQVALVGQGNKFELWDAPTWYQLRDQWLQDGNALTLSAELGRLSF